MSSGITHGSIGGLLMLPLQLMPATSQGPVALWACAPPLVCCHGLLRSCEPAVARGVVLGKELGAILQYVS